MIVVTGAAGFIASCLIGSLIEKGYKHIIAVDDFSKKEKAGNFIDKSIQEFSERAEFFEWLDQHAKEIEFIFHIGARTDTTEFNMAVFDELNTGYSMSVWNACSKYGIPLVYASSAATYGLGELGYADNHEIVNDLKPLNPYGVSKNDFDKWALAQESAPPFWAGMKFFNVYGPNEYHKGRMASVIFHAYHQINETGRVKLFRSHRPDFEDGGQLRDFIYVKDVTEVIFWIFDSMVQQGSWSKANNGIYNLGTGKARSFTDLVNATFKGLDLAPKIEFIDMPLDIRDKYQYFTEADMNKLQQAGYKKKFYSLEEGVDDYVRNYLATNQLY